MICMPLGAAPANAWPRSWKKSKKEYGSKIQIYKVDTDKEKQLSNLFNVSSIPLMVFIPKKGEPFLVTGLRPKEQLVEIINEKLMGQ